MDTQEFSDLFRNFKQSAFRLETLDEYAVPEEDEEFRKFLDGEPVSPSMNEEWATLVRQAVSAGKLMQRVHLLPDTLTPYLRYEIEWGYVFSAAAGEDIRLLRKRTVHRSMEFADFWMFDDEAVILMRYDPRGQFIAPEKVMEEQKVREFRRLREELLERAEPLKSYLARDRTS